MCWNILSQYGIFVLNFALQFENLVIDRGTNENNLLLKEQAESMKHKLVRLEQRAEEFAKMEVENMVGIIRLRTYFIPLYEVLYAGKLLPQFELSLFSPLKSRAI